MRWRILWVCLGLFHQDSLPYRLGGRAQREDLPPPGISLDSSDTPSMTGRASSSLSWAQFPRGLGWLALALAPPLVLVSSSPVLSAPARVLARSLPTGFGVRWASQHPAVLRLCPGPAVSLAPTPTHSPNGSAPTPALSRQRPLWARVHSAVTRFHRLAQLVPLSWRGTRSPRHCRHARPVDAE